MKRLTGTILVLGAWLGTTVLLANQPPSGADDFVPAGSLPPAAEGLPAAPMLIAAYIFVWAALVFYVWITWRKLQRVERDLSELERRAAQR